MVTHKLLLSPLQIGFGVAVGFRTGVVFIVTVTELLPVHPEGEVPVTV